MLGIGVEEIIVFKLLYGLLGLPASITGAALLDLLD